jgi:hypothetical protein
MRVFLGDLQSHQNKPMIAASYTYIIFNILILCQQVLLAGSITGDLLISPKEWILSNGQSPQRLAFVWQFTNETDNNLILRVRDLGTITIKKENGDKLDMIKNPQDHEKAIEKSDYLLIRPKQTLNIPYSIIFESSKKGTTIIFLYNSNENVGYKVKDINPGTYKISATYSTKSTSQSGLEGDLFEAFEEKEMKNYSKPFWIGEIKSSEIKIKIY